MTVVQAPSSSTRAALEASHAACELVRPLRKTRHDPGDRLTYAITGVVPAVPGRMTVEVEKAVGGGFAGQVYRVRLVELEGDVRGLVPGRRYAIKILTPPSAFSSAFRNALFAVGYQAHFAAQVNPASVRVGVLWQKLIRRAAAGRFGREDAVCDTFATFYDARLHAMGEINEWIEGRVWKFEVDDRLFQRWDFAGEPPPDHNTPEYVHKKRFMASLVELLHEMGAPELARQYEWWTLKSQPNALKRLSGEGSPERGLTAVDFRAGLVLLPFLPMSPADLWLILRGLAQGRLVQFDRADPARLEAFLAAHEAEFEDLAPAVEDLRQAEQAHRDSMLDLTGHPVRLLTDPGLRRAVREGFVVAWENLGRLDAGHARRLRESLPLFLLALLATAIPLLGGKLVKWWGEAVTREHVRRCVSSPRYLWRAMRGARVETLLGWQRAGRLPDATLLALVHRPVRFWLHRLAFGWLPVGLHRALTSWTYLRDKVKAAASFLFQFLWRPAFREEWLLEQVRLGHEEGMLSAEEADKVARDIKDPYIQKYLKCCAVHFCTVPVTQVTMVVAGGGAALYWYLTGAMTWVEAVAAGSAVGAVIQLSPVSPGSISRGLFVLYLMVRERDVKNYYVAAPVAFIHVVGYLAFPFQMVTHNPGLARFMAGRWATSLVHVLPVFGERGALMERVVFDLFFNLPLSMRRAARERPLVWAAGALAALFAVGLMGFAGYAHAWEWRQPEVALQGVTVRETIPYFHAGGDVHWSTSGTRVYLDGGPDAPAGPVDFPASHWDEAVGAGDRVDVVIRRSFLGDEWDGLAIQQRP